jgi:hypothetical protein
MASAKQPATNQSVGFIDPPAGDYDPESRMAAGECSSSLKKSNNREFFFERDEKPHGLRVFAILMHENRELTGNFRAKPLIQLELNDVFGILKQSIR